MLIASVAALGVACGAAWVQPAAGEDVVSRLAGLLETSSLRKVLADPLSHEPLSPDAAERARDLLVRAYTAEQERDRRGALDSRTVEAGGARMEYWYTVYGEKPPGGRSLYISMHGGGGTSKEVNDKQWENQQKLYRPEEGVYVAPRAPTDTWNMWHQAHMDALLDRLIADMIIFEGVDPDRVYLMGYSAGGDGVFQLAPRMADRFAAAAMMAGHPNETRPDGLRNLPFAIYMGGKDSAYNRAEKAREWKSQLAALAAEDSDGYEHEVVIHEDLGHWMERRDASAVPWMAGFTRELRPDRVVWLQDDVTGTRFYWVCNPEPAARQRIVVEREAQRITIQETGGAKRLSFLLDDSMLDLNMPVTVVANGRTLFEGLAPRTIGTMAATLLERGDPRGIFSARVDVEIPESEGSRDAP